MKLADYLIEMDISKAEFSRRTGLSEGTVSLLASGKSWPLKDTAQRIFAATGGKVTPTDFLRLAEAAQ